MMNSKSYQGVSVFLASEHKITLDGVIDSGLVTPDADGEKYLKEGTVLAKVTATGKLAPYDDSKTDGREVAVGILIYPVLASEDEMVSYLVHGVVIESKLTGIDANAKTDLKHILFV